MNNSVSETGPDNEIRALSNVLEDIRAALSGEFVSIAYLLEAFHERGLGIFLFLFALPAAVPLPGLGINIVIALPLLFLTAQLALGSHRIWLPRKIQARAFRRATLESVIDKALPWALRVEFLIRPRLGWLSRAPLSNLAGVAGVFMALAVCVPLPLTNTIPSLGIALIGIGVMMRDGLVILAGVLTGLAWIALLTGAALVFGMEGFHIIKDMLTGIFE